MNNNEQRKTTGDNEEQREKSVTVVGVRFAEGLLSDLDAEVEKRKQATPWAEVTRGDVIREAVYRLLHPQAKEQQQAAKESLPKMKSAPKPAGAVECVVCGEALPKNHKALCGKPTCKKESHRRREADRRKAAKGNRQPSD